MKTTILSIVALSLLGCAEARPAPTVGGGRLVLLVVIDQLRYADLLALAPELGKNGFAGLGAPAPLRYESEVTETAAGHATLSTGAWPDVHGIVGNTLFTDGVSRPAVKDDDCPTWEGNPGRSAKALVAPTVGDELKLATLGRARVVSISGKDRAALLLAGRSADAAVFFDVDNGLLTSTRCYGAAPPAWVMAARERVPVSKWLNWEWTPSRPLEVLQRYGASEPPGAVPAYGLGARFPHRVGQGDSTVRFYKALRSSPAGTEMLLEAARAAIDGLKLGDGGQSDLLLLSLSAADLVGHAFGTQSVERIDALLRMHDELTKFLAEERSRFGERLAVVLAADHGAPPLGGQAVSLRVPGGMTPAADVVEHLDRALLKTFGHAPHGGWVEYIDAPWIGLRRLPGLAPGEVAQAAAEALRKEPSILRALTAEEIEDEPEESSARRAYFPGRSGDVLLITRPGWTIPPQDDALEHHGRWNDSALVPLLIRAPGFELRSAAHGGTFRATQVAPSLARLLGVGPPAAALDEPAISRAAR